MRARFWVWAAPVLILAGGCGGESYGKRLEKTVIEKKREIRYRKNLEAAPSAEKRFNDLALYVRPPKGMALKKRGELPAPEGQYELDDTFADNSADAAFHVLARVKLPKKPPTKGQSAPPAPAPRGKFELDTLEILNSQFGPIEALATPTTAKWAPEQKGENKYQRLLLTTAGAKQMEVYAYRKDNTEAALVFVYDLKLRGALASKIEDCLTTFATGSKATRTFKNPNNPDDEDDAPPNNAI